MVTPARACTLLPTRLACHLNSRLHRLDECDGAAPSRQADLKNLWIVVLAMRTSVDSATKFHRSDLLTANLRPGKSELASQVKQSVILPVPGCGPPRPRGILAAAVLRWANRACGISSGANSP
jgi:hypothetical protein